MEGNRNTAQRVVNAENGFVEVVRGIAPEMSDVQARKVMALYLRIKAAKMDAVGGRINVVHGIYLDPQSLRNALAHAGG